MKRLAALLCVAALTLSLGACGAGAASSEMASSASASADGSDGASSETVSRQEHSTITMDVEGQSGDVPATLYQGSGWSIYVPDNGWMQDEQALWYAVDNEEVRLDVESREGTAEEPMTMQRCYESLVDEYGHSGSLSVAFSPLEGNTSIGTNSGCFRQVWLTEDGVNCWVVHGLYPADSAEGFGSRLAAIAATFEAD